ncbi:hypothetical protein TWF718_009755 [Orbilia javanica]|uniref:Uncharacterized protein n=1 Tax=Orbilia javanica TaxID=47235 RepID=A0AAN8NR00_9PEZI
MARRDSTGFYLTRIVQRGRLVGLLDDDGDDGGDDDEDDEKVGWNWNFQPRTC